MNLWTLIDGIITAPAWLLGYLFRAYVEAFKHGDHCYVSNVRKYWKGGGK